MYPSQSVHARRSLLGPAGRPGLSDDDDDDGEMLLHLKSKDTLPPNERRMRRLQYEGDASPGL